MRGLRAVLGLIAATAIMAATATSAGAADQTITFPTGSASAPYTPADVTIDPGQMVTFTGAFDNHPLVWNGGEFPTTSTGSSMAFTLSAPGVHRFHCQIHANMVGSVTVTGNRVATPDFTWAPASPQPGQAVTFSATSFTDPDGSIARYEWDLENDGSFEAAGPQVSRSFPAPGTYTVALRYVDDRSMTSPATTHAIAVVGGAGGGSGAGPGGSGAPNQPGAPSKPASPDAGTQGAGTSEETKAPRLRIAARALAFHNNKARVSVFVPRASTLAATLAHGHSTLATGRATTSRAQTKTIILKLTRAGSRALRRAHGRMRATLTVVAHARKGGKAATVRRTLSVRAR